MARQNSADGRLEIINQCVRKSISTKDPDASIRAFISEAGVRLKAHAVYIFTVIGPRTYDRTYVWREDGKEARADMQTITEDEFIPSWWESFHQGKIVVDDGMEKYRNTQAAGYNRTMQAEISTLVLCPVILAEDVYGIAVFSNVAPQYLHGCEEMFAILANYIATQLQNRKNMDKMVRDANYDPLTGVWSINAFWNALTPLIQAAKNGTAKEKTALIFFDIRNFKLLNGTRGHETGNQVLKELGHTIRRFSRSSLVCRSTGDRFYAALKDERAENVVRKVHDYMKFTAPVKCEIRAGIYTIDGSEISPSLAAGRAKLARDQILENRYLYYRRYEGRMEHRLLMDSYVDSHIDEALEKNWIQVYYHPVINLMDEKVHSFEALARWQDPEKGMLSPADFIPPLEDSWILYKLDLYVIHRVCEDMADQRKQGLPLSPVSFNLSRHDLELPDLHEKINRIVDYYHLDHRLIAMEITESALINNEKIIQRHIARFHQDGYEVWLDDFGSGYSSLNAVQSYSFDLLKIDMLFLRKQNEKTQAILMDIVDMAKSTGMQVLSEGVETKEQFALLKEIGCMYGQGFYFAKPLPKKECFATLAEKGYVQQSFRDHDFFEALGRVNVLHAHVRTSASFAGSQTPIAINVVQDGKMYTVYQNAACVDWLKFTGSGSQEDANAVTNARRTQNSLRIWECLSHLHEPGDSGYAEFVTKGYIWRLQYQLVAKDDDRTAYLTTIVNTDRTVSEQKDLTEGNEAEFIRSAVWKSVMNADTICLFWKDRDRRYLGANRAYLEMFNVSMEDLYGKTFGEVTHSLNTDAVDRIEKNMLETGVPLHRRIFTEMVNGRAHRFLASEAPVYKDGETAGLVGYTIDVTNEEEEKRILRNEAELDALTGIPNRRGFDRIMKEMSQQADLKKAMIVAVDVNKFKSFNDRWGHSAGDALLQSFADEAAALIQPEGILCRNGGDEFQMIFRNPEEEWGRKIDSFLSGMHMFTHGGSSYHYTLSGGAALYPDMGDDMKDLFEKADKALYHAKSMQRGGLCWYDASMENEPREQLGFNFADLAGGAPAAVLIYRFDESEEILYANKACITLFGCEDMQQFMTLTGRSFRTLVHPDDVTAVERSIALQQENPKADGYDFVLYRILTRQGEEKEILDIGRRIHDEYYGDIYYVLLWDNKSLLNMFRTQSGSMAVQVRGSEESDYNADETADFIRKLPGGMYCSRLSSPEYLEWASPGLIRMLGYTEKEFYDRIRHAFVNLMVQEDWEDYAKAGRLLAEKPCSGVCFYHLIRKDGTKILCMDVTRSEKGPDGMMYGYANVIDLSEVHLG